MAEHAIETERLGKAYRRYASHLDRVVELATLGGARRHREFWAVREVDLTVERGESLGLVGGNGAGKSTLLKMLGGTTAPSEGRFRIQGRVAGLLELGAGFHLELSGRENLMLAGLLLGLSRREVRAKESAILEFADIGEFVDQPVRTYSTGMAVRLSFALATALDPDVLLIDEVFAVGDIAFQKKCVDRIFDFKRAGKTIVLCSHSLYDVRQLCERALWLDRGRAMAIGAATAVTNDYASFQREHAGRAGVPQSSGAPPDGLPRIVDARVRRAGDERDVVEIEAGASIELAIWWSNPAPATHRIQLGVGFLRQDKTLVVGLTTHVDGVELEGSQGCAVLELERFPLLAGTFTILVVLFDGHGVHRHQEFTLPEDLVVRADTRELGLVRVPHRWRLEPRARSEP